MFRPYITDDFSACLTIFDTNVPDYFAPEERADCYEFLTTINLDTAPYWVFAQEENIIACGGLIIHAERKQARLAWGMVHNHFHGKGLGTKLTKVRINFAFKTPNIKEIGLETSQHTKAFYEKIGFRVTSIKKDGFAKGFDCYEMILNRDGD